MQATIKVKYQDDYLLLQYCYFDIILIKASEESCRFRGRGPGRDRWNPVLRLRTPPICKVISGGNFRGMLSEWESMTS